MLAPQTTPFFFGPQDRYLFGCLHHPTRGNSRKVGIIICGSVGPESISCNRAYRQLALRLSRSGFSVLRFDYFGCGDSSGDQQAGTLNQWLQDIALAIQELGARAHIHKFCLVGHRLGGALSLMTGSEKNEIESVVLWDPVVQGKEYLEELHGFQEELIRRLRVKAESASQVDSNELSGFPLTGTLQRSLLNLDLLSHSPGKPNAMLILNANNSHSVRQFSDRARQQGIQLDYEEYAAQHVDLEEINKVLVPNDILQKISSWIVHQCA